MALLFLFWGEHRSSGSRKKQVLGGGDTSIHSISDPFEVRTTKAKKFTSLHNSLMLGQFFEVQTWTCCWWSYGFSLGVLGSFPSLVLFSSARLEPCQWWRPNVVQEPDLQSWWCGWLRLQLDLQRCGLHHVIFLILHLGWGGFTTTPTRRAMRASWRVDSYDQQRSDRVMHPTEAVCVCHAAGPFDALFYHPRQQLR